MRTVEIKDIEYEVAQAKKALLEHFEMVITHPEAWARSRKKILDVFGEDGLARRLRNLFNVKEREGSDAN